MTDEPSTSDDAAASEEPWIGTFSIDGVDGGPIKLFQVGRKAFDRLSRLYRRLGARDRTQALLIAERLGLLV